MLDRAEGRSVAAGDDDRGNHRGTQQARLEEFQDARTLQLARLLLLCPQRRLGQERADDHQRNGGDQAGDQRVPPGFVAAVDGREGLSVGHGKVIRAGHHEPADRTECLRPAQRGLALLGRREEFGEPGDRGDELDGDSDERGAAEEQQHFRARREARRPGGKAVQQDAPHQDRTPPQAVGQPPPEQAEYAAEYSRNVEEQADPLIELRRPRPDVRQLQQSRTNDQRQHQEFIDVERKAQRCDAADQPLRSGEFGQLVAQLETPSMSVAARAFRQRTSESARIPPQPSLRNGRAQPPE